VQNADFLNVTNAKFSCQFKGLIRYVLLTQNVLLLHTVVKLIRVQCVGMYSVFVNLKSFYFFVFLVLRDGAGSVQGAS